jgi:hypothetical protein
MVDLEEKQENGGGHLSEAPMYTPATLGCRHEMKKGHRGKVLNRDFPSQGNRSRGACLYRRDLAKIAILNLLRDIAYQWVAVFLGRFNHGLYASLFSLPD